ncbi:hypothetical protein BCR44DRAFT_1459981 [Catenaria anguillulae PL171]|uniref:Pentacotripeptide-repeat region of PRORP domain-containing protein n=1 Tax=Catenaria anguillulae PL171 TaxID=765915 RepID=A0A1Y2HR41_9FUNG|nr:hypothetical protein BCR44DRAFT_1459981 [Catenaria anguillulae PL171]
MTAATTTYSATRRLPQPLRTVLLSSRTFGLLPSCVCTPVTRHDSLASRSPTLAISCISAASSCIPAVHSRHGFCRAFSSQASPTDRTRRPSSAPLFVVPADDSAVGSSDPSPPQQPPPPPPPESLTVDDLVANLPTVLAAGDPATIFAYYAALFNSHPPALTEPRILDILNALAPSDTYGCINIFQDWNIRQRSLHDASQAPSLSATASLTSSSSSPVLLTFLLALRHAPSPEAFVTGINAAVSALAHADNHHLHGPTAWWRLLDTVLDMYAPDMFSSRMLVAGPLALDILRKAKAAATSLEGHGAFDWNPSIALRYEIRALGQASDLDSLRHLFQQVSAQLMDTSLPPHPSEWITAFARAGDFDRARSLFVTCVQSEIVPSIESAYALLLRAARSNNLQATIDLQSALFDVYGPDIDDPSHPGINLYSPLLEACRASLSEHRFARYPTPADWTHRLHVAKVFQETRATIARLGLHLSESAHESILACLVLANYDDHYRYPLKDAAAALEAMIQHGYMPTQYAIHTLMRGYANTRENVNVHDRVKVILQYMGIMRACGVPVTAETYSIAFLALKPRKPIVKKRVAVIQQLHDLHREMTHQHGIPHTHQSMHAYLRVMGVHGGWNHLYRAFDTMTARYGLERNATTYFTMMHALHRDAAGAQYAIEVLEPQMRAEGVRLTPDIAHTLLACCVTVNNEKVAWQVFEAMGHAGMPVTHTVLNYLLKMALFNGRLAHAQFVLDEFGRRGMFFDPTTYYHLMTYFTKLKPDQDKVYELIERLRGQADLCEQYSLISGCLVADLVQPTKSVGSASALVAFNPLPTELANELGEPAIEVAQRKAESASAKVDPAARSLVQLTIPPLPSLPSETCHPLQRPIQVLIDSRLHLKALQLHIGNQDYIKAFQTFTTLLCDFHVALLHRFAMARQYRAEAIADFAAREAAAQAAKAADAADDDEEAVQAVISRQPMLSYPPRIVHYEPYNARAGLLYLPKDVATATWLMCQSLLHMPGDKLPSDFPAFRYVHLKPPRDVVAKAGKQGKRTATVANADAAVHAPRSYTEAASAAKAPRALAESATTSRAANTNGSAQTHVWDAADEYLSRITFKSLAVAGMNKVAVARVVFRTSLRALNAFLGFPTMIRFDWVKDLMHKLSFDIDYKDRYRVQIRRAGMFEEAAVTKGKDEEERERTVDPVFSGMPQSVIEQLVWNERKRRDAIVRYKAATAAAPADGKATKDPLGAAAADMEASAAPRAAAVKPEDIRTLTALLGVQIDDKNQRFTRLPYTSASPETLSELMVRELPEEEQDLDEDALPARERPTPASKKVARNVLVDEAVMEHEIQKGDDGIDYANEVRKTMYAEKPRGKVGRSARVSAEKALERDGPLDL